ncbi:MAG: glutamate-cysteine ligase family protein [Myxococcota bacterium]
MGTEAERIAVQRPSGKPLPYEGEIGVSSIFEALIEGHGWEPERETEDGPIVALRRGQASVTLEPGSQVELSGAPYASVQEGKAESDAHWAELAPVIDKLGLVWLGLGCQPFASIEELGLVPKLRYGVMREYMPTRGPLAAHMMTKTATVQANLDYASEEDAMRKLRVGLRAQPLVTAMFSNSPWNEGRRSGYASYRSLIWQHMDPDRSGLLPFAWSDRTRYLDYVRWALDAPMFLVKRGPEVHYNTGQTFRSFMQDGFQGVKPNYSDWAIHLSTLFPEVRLKTTLEYRGADAQRGALSFALPALWKGLLYDDESLSRLEAMVDPWSFGEVETQREALARHGIRTRFFKREAGDWAGELLELAEAGLKRLSSTSPDDDAALLSPLRTLVEQTKTPADVLLETVPDDQPTPDAVIEAAGGIH